MDDADPRVVVRAQVAISGWWRCQRLQRAETWRPQNQGRVVRGLHSLHYTICRMRKDAQAGDLCGGSAAAGFGVPLADGR